VVVLLSFVAMPAPVPPPPPPLSACLPPHDNYTFCNQSLPVAERAHSLASLLTLPELYSQLTSATVQAAIPRLGINSSYTYGSEVGLFLCPTENLLEHTQ
jgi:hypothetical protein